MVKQVRANQYDLVINLHRFMSSGLITIFSKAPQSFGFDKNPMSKRFTHTMPHIIGEKENLLHEIDRNLSLIKHITNEKRILPKLYPSLADYQKMKTEGTYICIAPTSIWFTKQWPQDKWVSMIDQL